MLLLIESTPPVPVNSTLLNVIFVVAAKALKLIKLKIEFVNLMVDVPWLSVKFGYSSGSKLSQKDGLAHQRLFNSV